MVKYFRSADWLTYVFAEPRSRDKPPSESHLKREALMKPANQAPLAHQIKAQYMSIRPVILNPYWGSTIIARGIKFNLALSRERW
jgi:hypothetical protein